MPWDRPRICTVDRGRQRQSEHYWNLSKLDFWYHTIPCSHAAEGYEQCSNAVDNCRWRSNACERMRRCQWECHINLGLLTVKYGGVFWDHIVSYRDILCSIMSYPSFSPMAISCHHYHRQPQCAHYERNVHVTTVTCALCRSENARRMTNHVSDCHGDQQRRWSSAAAGVDLTLMSLHAAYAR